MRIIPYDDYCAAGLRHGLQSVVHVLGLLVLFLQVAVRPEPILSAVETGRGSLALDDLKIFSRANGYPTFLCERDKDPSQTWIVISAKVLGAK